jgi:geranylgeranyl diphosphate synthase type II
MVPMQMEKLEAYKQKINHFLAEENFKKQPSNLYGPIHYTLNLGGKRLRPVLTLAACDLFSGNVDDALQPAIGIEIFHNFTLLHDDIMDDAPQRRGKETVYKKWNSNIAILSGDTMFALAYSYFNSVENRILPGVLETFTHTAIEVCEGQQYDMDFESREDVTISEYLEMIRLKTAVLLGASLKIGALVANAPADQAKLIYDFGVNAGLAFQLKDDWLDAFGNEEKFGKSLGGDIAANKKTYLYLKCLEKASPADSKKLIKLFSGQQPEPAVKIGRVLDLYEKYQVNKESTREMEYFFNLALKAIKNISAHQGKKESLIAYAEWLYKRDY